MAGRGRPGSALQTDKREAYARLITAGVSSLQACRMVGINPRTGKRWRHGRTITSSGGGRLHYPPVINSPVREVSPRFLSEDERVAIADLHRRGRGARAIAREVGRRPGHDQPGVAPQPRPGQRAVPAVRRAAHGGRPSGSAAGAASWRAMASWPGSWRSSCGGGGARSRSARRCASEFPDEPCPSSGARDDLPGALPARGSTLRRELPPRVLRTGRRRRRSRRHPNARRGRLVNMTMIDQRPAEVAERSDARALGGRSDHRGQQPVGDRDAGGAHLAVHHPAASARRPRCPGRA